MRIHLRTEYVNKVATREILIENVTSVEFDSGGVSFVKDGDHYSIPMLPGSEFRYLGTEYDFCFVRS